MGRWRVDLIEPTHDVTETRMSISRSNFGPFHFLIFLITADSCEDPTTTHARRSVGGHRGRSESSARMDGARQLAAATSTLSGLLSDLSSGRCPHAQRALQT